jgi:putative protein kinase ArgK-like GTPase of G3E family
VKTVATSGEGIQALVEAIAEFRARGQRGDREGATTAGNRRRARAEQRLREIVTRRFLDHLARDVIAPDEWTAVVDRIAAREVDPYSAADALLSRAMSDSKRP